MNARVHSPPTHKDAKPARATKPRRAKVPGTPEREPHDTLQQNASALVAARHAARQAEIAKEAYLRAERRGFEPGFELDDWLAAEASLDGSPPHASMDDPVGVNAADSHYASEIQE